jgi:hypothetical protein
VSINNANSKFEALRLPPDALDDSFAAQRFLARTYSGPGSRPGLIRSPVAACVTAEGAILVLESSTANNRIQAFDLGGNPLRYFTDQRNPYFLHLIATEGWTYLDVAVGRVLRLSAWTSIILHNRRTNRSARQWV